MSAKEFAFQALIEPLKNNAASVIFWAGAAAVFIGGIGGDAIDSWRYVPKGTGEAILKIGSAMLGAGVFAVILKSGQFTDLFKKHIGDVFYDPLKCISPDEILFKWKMVTNAILKNALPSMHSQITEKIQRQFLDDETHFHFEKFDITYDIKVDADSRHAVINNTMRVRLIVSPSQQDPMLEQQMNVGGRCELKTLIINDLQENVDKHLFTDENDLDNRRLKVDLKKYLKTSGDVRYVDFERTLEVSQSLVDEPFVFATISRYIKGAVVRARISPGFELYFLRSGINESARLSHDKDGQGFNRWILAHENELLLPGQAYTIMLVPIREIKASTALQSHKS